MATLNIPRSNGVRFIIDTGTGKINQGAIIEGNEFYPQDETECGVWYPAYAQCFETGDNVVAEVEYDDSTNTVEILVEDSDGVYVGLYSAFQIGTTDYYYWTFSLFTEGCFDLHITSVEPAGTGSNLFTNGQNGTMDNILDITTGPNHAKSQNGAIVQASTFSLQLTNSGVLAPGDELIMEGDTTYTLVQGNRYEVTAWIYNPSSNPMVTNFLCFITFDLDEWADAITITGGSAFFTALDPQDTWTKITAQFIVNTDVKGKVRIAATDYTTLTAGGILLVDTVSMKQVQYSIEATSEPVSVQAACDCHAEATWSCNEASFNGEYDLGTGFLSYRARLPLEKSRMLIDSDREVFVDSAGQRTVVFSRNSKRIPFNVGYMPDYQIEILRLAMEHDTFTINGEQYVLEDTYEPDTIPNYGLRSGQVELLLADYNEQNNNC